MMSTQMPAVLSTVALDAVAVQGPDATSFLQGQLSADLQELSPSRVLLAGCHSVQGRVQAVLTIVQRPEAILLVTTAALVDRLLARLRPYVLRSRVSLQSAAGRYRFATDAFDPAGRTHGATSATSSALQPGQHVLDGATSIVRPVGGAPRQLYVLPGETNLYSNATEAWRLADIRAGIPNTHEATWEVFISQMLNLDLLGGISFSKGCYTGQEIIARAHYRGAVKRRMFRFACARREPPPPGARVLADAAHAGDVVDAAPAANGCELLAVISLDKLARRLELEDGTVLQKLELPYEEGLRG